VKGESNEPSELTLTLIDVTTTEKLGAVLADVLPEGVLVFLTGELGTGKTTLVRGVLRALGYQGAVKSPTYTLLEEYSLAGREIIHFDLYRLIDPEELELIGIRDYFNDKACCFVEWPARGEGYLPPEDLLVWMSHRGSGREVRISATSNRGKEMVGSIQTVLCQESG